MDLAAGKREKGKEADTAHVRDGAFSGKQKRNVWLEEREPACFMLPPWEAKSKSGVWTSHGRDKWRSGAAWQLWHTGTLQMEKETSEPGQIFQGYCQLT